MCIGTTFAVFKLLGKTPLEKEVFITVAKACVKVLLVLAIFSGSILESRVDLFFSFDMISWTSCGDVGLRNID